MPFPTSAIEILRWRLGDPLLARRVLLADTVAAPQAVAERLADEAVPAADLLSRALAVAGSLGDVPPRTFALTKAQLQADVRQRIAARQADWEAQVAEMWASEPVLTGIERFVARTLRR